ncbi:hypothetical protein [Flavicella sp.]|uniref:hypothetical protein n=1 Tax=Flavicella sp. TaxID=2957742 RepID=UPI00261FD206|nr:hypothetical protein [Flavicella sp.]MDG1803546.1 hypothetical protein [Flavicella sp.]
MLKKIILLLTTILTTACSDSKTEDINSDCNPIDIVCTEEFRSITLEIIDINDNPVILDAFKIIREDTGEEIESSENFHQNFYTIINDNYQNEIAQKEINLKFTGFINNIEVLSTNYVVSADCCHIELISGKTKIVL